MDFHLIDLSQPIDQNAPTWKGTCGFQQKEIEHYTTHGYQTYEQSHIAGIGTHLDAPSHFFPTGSSIHQIPLESLFVPICLINIAPIQRADAQIGLKEIERFEKEKGKIPSGAVVIGCTGWSRYWNDSKKYRNQDEKGVMRFPTFSESVLPLLLERNIVGVGIDTLSPDPEDSSFPIHHTLLGKGKYLIENLAGLHLLPPTGAFLFAPPMNVIGASEAPVRAVAFIPNIVASILNDTFGLARKPHD